MNEIETAKDRIVVLPGPDQPEPVRASATVPGGGEPNKLDAIQERALALLERIKSATPDPVLGIVYRVLRMNTRYGEADGSVQASAITFYGFLAVFPLVALAVSVAGLVLRGRPDQLAHVTELITQAIPSLDVAAVVNVSGLTGVIAAVGLILSGAGWFAGLRVGLRKMWLLPGEAEGNLATRKIADIVTLLAFGAVLVLSTAATGLVSYLLALPDVRLPFGVAGALSWAGRILTFGVGVAAFGTLYWAMVGKRAGKRRVIRAAMLSSFGFELLKILGVAYVGRVTANPVFGAFALAVGLLVWINFATRIMLYSMAWVATSSWVSPGADDPSAPVAT